jgi:hypothetical protein
LANGRKPALKCKLGNSCSLVEEQSGTAWWRTQS